LIEEEETQEAATRIYQTNSKMRECNMLSWPEEETRESRWMESCFKPAEKNRLNDFRCSIVHCYCLQNRAGTRGDERTERTLSFGVIVIYDIRSVRERFMNVRFPTCRRDRLVVATHFS
jgi:hypothetical protein